MVNSVTGNLEPEETPAWQRLAFRYLVSYPIIGLCLLLVFIVMFAMLQLQVTPKNFISVGTFQFQQTSSDLSLGDP